LLWGITGKLKRVGDEHDRVVSLYAPAGLARVVLGLGDEKGAFLLVRTMLEKEDTLRFKIGDRTLEGPIAEGALLNRLWDSSTSSPTPFNDLHEVMTRSAYLQQDQVRQFIDVDTEAQ
jgi:hypothetical protein